MDESSSIDVLFLSLSSLFLLSNHLVRILLFIIYGLLLFFSFFFFTRGFSRLWKCARKILYPTLEKPETCNNNVCRNVWRSEREGGGKKKIEREADNAYY